MRFIMHIDVQWHVTIIRIAPENTLISFPLSLRRENVQM